MKTQTFFLHVLCTDWCMNNLEDLGMTMWYLVADARCRHDQHYANIIFCSNPVVNSNEINELEMYATQHQTDDYLLTPGGSRSKLSLYLCQYLTHFSIHQWDRWQNLRMALCEFLAGTSIHTLCCLELLKCFRSNIWSLVYHPNRSAVWMMVLFICVL